MALIAVRSTFSRAGSVKSVLGCKVHPSAATCPIQVATLKATFGEPYPYAEPYPYKTKSYGMLHEFFENSSDRMCENSKIITVDGNIGVGKNEFAKKLAKEFDLQYVPSTLDSECFRMKENSFDLRDLNELLPPTSQFYDLESFLKEKKTDHGFVGRLQLLWYEQKFHVYSQALQHLFHTGQGSVIVRSCYSDNVFTEAMYRCGYVTKNFTRFYNKFRDNSMCELLKPHVSIYLDAPVSVIKERIKKRNNPLEQGSLTLNDKYLKAIQDSYKEVFLPRMREHGEILEIDWSEVADDLDTDAIAAEIATMTLEAEDVHDKKFKDWYKLKEDKLCWYRRRYGKTDLIMEYMNIPPPTDCPEIMYPEADFQKLSQIVTMHPAIRYANNCAPQLGHASLLKFP